MSETTQTTNIEQTLNRTDLGHTLYEHRKLFFGLILAILLGVTGYLIWLQGQKSSALENSVKVFEFQSGIWADVKAEKTGIPELLKAFEALPVEAQTAPVMLPLALEISKFLYDKGNYAEADAVLSKYSAGAKQPVAAFFVNHQRAVILEKMGKVDEAIAVLEPLAQNKDGLMAPKISVDLGRLYLKKGEKGKAQTQFDYVLTTFPNDDQAKLAKLYLSQLNQ